MLAVPYSCPSASGQQQAPDPKTFRVEALVGAIQVDGILNEQVWLKAPTFTLDYETSPGDNVSPLVRTEMWITYDPSRLYVAARAYDPNPQEIRAHMTDRDRAYQDDFLGVVLDTFHDQRRSFEFFVNPLGVQMDLLQSDITKSEDDSWDAIWDSAGHVTANGYEVEFAIPFSSLRFPRTSAVQVWGIDALRIYPRNHRYRIGLNRVPRGGNCYLCNESTLVGFEEVVAGRNLELAPTLTAHRFEQRDDQSDPFEKDQQADAGITTRWGVTPGITINGAVNPDFSQVEADAAQLTANTQFAIFYPEKRPFFLEGADLFETRIGAVYTRNIADPSWGIKISGKTGKNAFAAIVARDSRTNFIFPSNQSTDLGSMNGGNTSTLVRYRYDLGSGSSIGGLFTDREGSNYYNRMIGADTLLRWGNEEVRIEALGSTTSYPLDVRNEFNQPSGPLWGTALRAVHRHQTRTWTSGLQYSEASADFRADLGFIPQVGYHMGFGFVERYIYADDDHHWWRRLTIGAETSWFYDRNGDPLQQQVAPFFRINASRQFFSELYLGLGPSYFNGKRFDRNFINEYLEMRPSASIYINLESRLGQEIDYANARQGSIVRLIPGVEFELGRHLRLKLNHNFERLRVQSGELFRANVSEVRTTYQFSNRTFVRIITQYFDVRRNPALYTFAVTPVDHTLLNQFLFSYKINPQAVLFLGYSDNYQNNPLHDLTQVDRTVFFKVGYAFVL